MLADLWNALLELCEARYAAIGQRETKYYYDKKGRLQQTFTGRFLTFHCADCAQLSGESGKLKTCEQHKMPGGYGMSYLITEMLQACPEWRAMPALTVHALGARLTKAFDAFFRRCRAGAEAVGYPKPKRYRNAPSIPLGTGTRNDAKTGRKVWKSGWRFLQREDNPKSWSLYYGAGADLKDRATWIHARGRFPAAVNDINNGDIIFRDGKWHLSLCVAQNGRRWPGEERIVVHMDAIDCFAIVNGEPVYLDGLADAARLEKESDALKSARDGRWPKPPRRDGVDRGEWSEACAEIARLQGKAARIRHNALHVWTSSIVKRAGDLTIIIPPSIKEVTASARGDDKQWGANVAPVAEINRHVLNQAPALARAMLEYKAAEAGIRCDVVADTSPKAAVGGGLKAAGKELRKAQRKLKDRKNELSEQGI
jgi:hypothetical protein